MGWLRSHVRLGSWLALLALTAQLALAFGHAHLDGLGARSTQSAGAIHALAALPDAPADPAHQVPAGLVDGYCAVCAVMQLAAMAAVPPAMPLPAAIGRVALDLGPDRARAPSPHPSFRARAPPHV
jgi:hypothetical protein